MSRPAHAAPDAAGFRRLMSHYPTGIIVVTVTAPDGLPLGVAFGSFTSVSLDPLLIGFLPARTSTTWPRIERVGRFCVNILSQHQEALCRRFAMSGGDKFAGIETDESPNGSPVLGGALAWIDCDLHAVHEAGDHLFVTGLVTAASDASGAAPLLFWRNGYAACDVDGER